MRVGMAKSPAGCRLFHVFRVLSCARVRLGGQGAAGAGGPIAATQSDCHAAIHGQRSGRWRTSRLPEVAIRAGRVMIRVLSLIHI